MRPRAVEVRVVASVPQRAPSREQSTADPCTAELKPRCTRLPRSSSPDNLPAKPRRSLSRCRSPTLRPCLAQEPRANRWHVACCSIFHGARLPEALLDTLRTRGCAGRVPRRAHGEHRGGGGNRAGARRAAGEGGVAGRGPAAATEAGRGESGEVVRRPPPEGGVREYRDRGG